MKAQRMYDFICKLKKNNSIYEKDSIRLFKFLYDDVRGYFTNIIADENSDVTFENMLDEIDEIIDGDDSIFDYYEKMINDGKNEYINVFLLNVNNVLDFFDNKLYRDNDYKPYTFIFNIYIMLKLYDVYKDDFDKYSKFINDFSFFIGYGKIEDDYSGGYEYALFSEKLNFINNILEVNVIEDFPEVKNILIDFVKDICSLYDYGDLDDLEDKSLDFISLLNGIKYIRNYPNFNEEVLKSFFEEVLSEEENDMYYYPILMLGDRYEYLMDKYDVIDNSSIFDEILERACSLDIDFFQELDTSKDMFIDIMDAIFDSDSFYELESKIEVLEKASEIYGCDGLTKECLELVKSLKSENHKKEIEGITIKYSSSSNNIISKSLRIIDRSHEILKLYSDVLKYTDDDFDEILLYSENMSEADDRLSSFVYRALDEKRSRLKDEKSVSSSPQQITAVEVVDDVKPDTNIKKIKSIFGRRK